MRLCHSRKIRWCRYVKYIIFYVKAILFLRSHWLSNGNMANVKQSRLLAGMVAGGDSWEFDVDSQNREFGI